MPGLRLPDVIDLHVHFGPDSVGGAQTTVTPSVSAVQAAREARDSGHAAVVLKSHSFASPVVAAAVSEAVPGIRVFGGICTDYPSGGLNVQAVESALAMGARIVWLPTLHGALDVSRHDPTGVPGIRVTDDAGRVVDEVHEIFGLVREHDAILATGHISAPEHRAVVREFARHGKVLVTHAGEALAGPNLSPTEAAEFADLGATIEITALACQTVMGHRGRDPEEVAAMIREIGYERCTLSTDYGWTTEIPKPAEGHREFLELLWGEGFTEAELRRMASITPAGLLGAPLGA